MQAPWTGFNLDASGTENNALGNIGWTASSQQKQDEEGNLVGRFHQFGPSPFSSSLPAAKCKAPPESTFLQTSEDSFLGPGLFSQSKELPLPHNKQNLQSPFSEMKNNISENPLLSGDLSGLLQNNSEILKKNESVFNTMSNWGLSNFGSTSEQDLSKPSAADESFSQFSSFLATVSENSNNDGCDSSSL